MIHFVNVSFCIHPVFDGINDSCIENERLYLNIKLYYKLKAELNIESK